MSPKHRLFLALPEVRRLTDRIPISRVLLKADAITLRYMSHARSAKLPLKQQCADLDIPWHARRIPAAFCDKPTLARRLVTASRHLTASDFVRLMPAVITEAEHWAASIELALARSLQPDALRWVAHHSCALVYRDVDQAISDLVVIGGLNHPQNAVPLNLTPQGLRRRADAVNRGHVIEWFGIDHAEQHIGGRIDRIIMDHVADVMAGGVQQPRARAGFLPWFRGGFFAPVESPSPDAQEPLNYSLSVTIDKWRIALLSDEVALRHWGELLNNCLQDGSYRAKYFDAMRRRVLYVAGVTLAENAMAVGIAALAKDFEILELRGHTNSQVSGQLGLTAALAAFAEAARHHVDGWR